MDNSTLEFGETKKVPIRGLRLDSLNPRLLSGAEDDSDEAIIARLYRGAELSELLTSISTNGYLDIEPLVVMRAPNSTEYIVLEGNRRLATLRLFREPDLVDSIKSREGITIIIPSVDPSLEATFDKVSVYLVKSSGTCPFLYWIQAHQWTGQVECLRKGSIRCRMVQKHLRWKGP